MRRRRRASRRRDRSHRRAPSESTPRCTARKHKRPLHLVRTRLPREPLHQGGLHDLLRRHMAHRRPPGRPSVPLDRTERDQPAEEKRPVLTRLMGEHKVKLAEARPESAL